MADGEFRRLLVNLTPEQHEFLREVAFRRRVSMSVLVRELVEEAQARARWAPATAPMRSPRPRRGRPK